MGAIMNKIVNYFSNIFEAMANGIFSTLIVGLVVEQLAGMLGWTEIAQVAVFAQYTTGAAIGFSVALKMKYKPITSISAGIVGFVGGGTIESGMMTIPDPFTTILSVLVVLPLLNFFEKKMPLDSLIIPTIAMILSFYSHMIFEPMSLKVLEFGEVLNNSVTEFPALGAIFIATVMAFAISGPFSSAMIGLMLGLDGQIAFAALCSCSAQMAGFFVMGIRDNGFVNSLLLLLGSPKMIMKNITKKPILFIPPLIASVLTALLSIFIVDISTTAEASGMGSVAFVGQILTLDNIGYTSANIFIVAMFTFVIPMLITFIVYNTFTLKKWIRKGDLII